MGENAYWKGYNFDYDRQYLDLDKGFTVLNSILTAKVTLPLGITYSFNVSPRLQYFMIATTDHQNILIGKRKQMIV